eukprot:SAG31_NODE_311_length_17866_cov_7.010750_5_plen_128_part_00
MSAALRVQIEGAPLSGRSRAPIHPNADVVGRIIVSSSHDTPMAILRLKCLARVLLELGVEGHVRLLAAPVELDAVKSIAHECANVAFIVNQMLSLLSARATILIKAHLDLTAVPVLHELRHVWKLLD